MSRCLFCGFNVEVFAQARQPSVSAFCVGPAPSFSIGCPKKEREDNTRDLPPLRTADSTLRNCSIDGVAVDACYWRVRGQSMQGVRPPVSPAADILPSSLQLISV